MLINSFLLNVRHPMKSLPRDNRIYLATDGVTEIFGPGYQDTRFFLVAMFDPFDIIGMCLGRNMNRKFWETHEEGRVVEREENSNNDEEKGTASISS